jgi:hypothetical protein
VTRRRAGRGQAAVEVLALLPALVLVALLGWQLAAVLSAALEADARVRDEALGARRGGRVLVVGASARAHGFLPGLGGVSVPARVGVRTP